jgi:hypothetical protein
MRGWSAVQVDLVLGTIQRKAMADREHTHLRGDTAGYHPVSMTSCIGRENSSWVDISCPICLVDSTARAFAGRFIELATGVSRA